MTQCRSHPIFSRLSPRGTSTCSSLEELDSLRTIPKLVACADTFSQSTSTPVRWRLAFVRHSDGPTTSARGGDAIGKRYAVMIEDRSTHLPSHARRERYIEQGERGIA